jgi:hypothetical protein
VFAGKEHQSKFSYMNRLELREPEYLRSIEGLSPITLGFICFARFMEMFVHPIIRLKPQLRYTVAMANYLFPEKLSKILSSLTFVIFTCRCKFSHHIALQPTTSIKILLDIRFLVRSSCFLWADNQFNT